MQGLIPTLAAYRNYTAFSCGLHELIADYTHVRV